MLLVVYMYHIHYVGTRSQGGNCSSISCLFPGGGNDALGFFEYYVRAERAFAAARSRSGLLYKSVFIPREVHNELEPPRCFRPAMRNRSGRLH